MTGKAQGKSGESPSLEILAVVPARGGSKGLAQKNVRPLAGKPLIAYTIEAALGSRYGLRVVVSTDDEKTASVAQEAGAQVPFMRPPVLAEDATPMFPVVKHAVQWLAQHESYEPDLIVLLQPTSPLRRAEHIDEAIELVLSSGADSAVSLCETEHSPYWMQVVDSKGMVKPFMDARKEHTRRQNLPTVYRLNGAVLVTRRTVLNQGRLLGDNTRAFIMDREVSVDIDDEIDFLLAEMLIQRRQGAEGTQA